MHLLGATPLGWGCFFYISLALARGGEIFDVTTVYDIDTPCEEDSNENEDATLMTEQWGFPTEADDDSGSTTDATPTLPPPRSYCVTGRVHVLSNGLGMRLIANDNITEVEVQQPLNDITCDLANDKCPWIGTGWQIDNEVTEIKEGKSYKMREGARISFQSLAKYYDQYYGVYFTSTPTVSSISVKYLIRYTPGNADLYTGCGSIISSNYNFDVKNHDYEDIPIYCREHSDTQEVQPPYGSLSFSFTNNTVQILNRKMTPPQVVMNWNDPMATSQDVKYFSMCGNLFNDSGATIEVPVYVSSQASSELESGPLTFADTRLCLALVVHSPIDHAGDLLSVSAHDLSGQVTHSERLVYNFKSGWNYKHVQLVFDGSINEAFKLIIRTTTSIKIKISRVSTCNPDEEDIVHLPIEKVGSPDGHFKYGQKHTVYTVSSPADVMDPVDESDIRNIGNNEYSWWITPPTGMRKNYCLNGGVSTKDGCSCQPGFSGVNCQIGCGRNRFGRDCGAVCSLRNRECRGLLMCTLATGCRCAPGYWGGRCEFGCTGGRYGNDCVQPCGNCADYNDCDVFTGECLACQSGYRPPYCKQPYVYLALKPEVSARDFGVIQVNFDPKNYVSVDEEPELYQIQYKERDCQWKISTTKSVNESDLDGGKRVEAIEGLKAGYFYTVRVLLMDSNFNKYDGPLVQTSEILTKCNIPDVYDYHVRYSSNTTSFTFSWEYVNTTENWCPVSSYEVSWKERWEWTSAKVDANSFTLTDFRPGSTIEFKVRTKTVAGFAPPSLTISASTLRNGTSGVRNLRVVSSRSTAVTVAWSPPGDTLGHRLLYTLTYKCVDQPACSPGCVNATEGALSQQDTSVTLSSLLPFARYQVSVTPDNGPESSIFVGTSKVAPAEKPLLSETNKIERANTSLKVFWEPVPVCSGFMLGYNYQLAKESEPLKVVVGGFTRGTSFTFRNLSASTAYVVRVYTVTVAGWNPDAYLEINTSTTATVPDVVRELAVYKRGRGALGLRWAAPLSIYGTLKSFVVSVGEGSGVGQSRSVEPRRCSVWPQLYCHTVEGLRANRKYNLSVSARNSEVAEDGAKAWVTAVTKEGPPSAPVGLRLSNASETSVGLRWEHPDLANGQLRSFVVSVEETERVDQDACCQVYPLIETSVGEEHQIYEAEVSGLQPAATYYVSVSAKTVGLGPAQSLVVHTRPPHLPLTVLPSLEDMWDDESPWLLQEPTSVTNDTDDNYVNLIKAHLLLVEANESNDMDEVTSGISVLEVDSLIKSKLEDHFYFLSEYSEGDIVSDLLASLSSSLVESHWGEAPPSLVTVTGSCRLVAVQVTEYSGSYNVDLVRSSQHDCSDLIR